MSQNDAFLDIAQGGVRDAGTIAMDAILATDSAVRGLLGSFGLSYTVQSWLFAIILAVIVIVMMNQLRFLWRGGLLLVISMMAVELIKPAFVAIGARLLMTH
ncbi:MAG TPA: hypothetical protein VFG62_00485 [Rhodopila sp.]|nr:hypothetical protein [Rhodopila sp.]